MQFRVKDREVKVLTECSFIFILAMICCASCTKSNDDDNLYKYVINKNIQTVATRNQYGEVNLNCGTWLPDDKIYSIGPLCYYEIDKDFQVIKDTIIKLSAGGFYIESFGNKILYVQTIYGDVSCGSLLEFSNDNYSIKKILDSSYSVSSAIYYRDTNQIIYYSYGKPLGMHPGYYYLNLKTGESRFLLEYVSDLGPSEFINGFDIHPAKDIILIPVVKRGKSPVIVEYNFELNTFDTLHVDFDFSFNRTCLWLRYNQSGEKILYSCYPRHAGSSTTNDDSEVGIIYVNSLSKRVLDVNTNRINGRSVNVCPNWSPDEKHIIYGSGPLTLEGARGIYYLYILKNVEQ